MDNKAVGYVAVIVIAVVCIVGGYMLFGNGSDDKTDITGEWASTCSGGYGIDDKYDFSDDREFQKAFDIDITTMEHNVIVMKMGDNVFKGTYNGNEYYLTLTTAGEGDTVTAIGELVDGELMFTYLSFESGKTSVYGHVYTRDGAQSSKEIVISDIPVDWQMAYGNAFNGTDHGLDGSVLTIKDQSGGAIFGEKQQGDDTVTIKGMTLFSNLNSDLKRIYAIDGNGHAWRINYSAANDSLSCNGVGGSLLFGVSAYTRNYITADGEYIEVPNDDLTGLTWCGTGQWSLDNDDNVVKNESLTYKVNITSQNGRQISGTLTVNDSKVFDLAGYFVKDGFDFITQSSDVTVRGTAVLSSDLKSMTLLENYSVSNDGFVIIGSEQLELVEPTVNNKFLGEWDIQYYAAYVNGEYKSDYLTDESYNITVESIKNGLFYGTIGDMPIVGNAGNIAISFTCDIGGYSADFTGYIDKKGVLQIHVILTNAENYLVCNSLYTKGEKTTDLSTDYETLSASYSSVAFKFYDGTEVSDAGEATLKVDQKGTLFKAELTTSIGTVTRVGFMINAGGICNGKSISEVGNKTSLTMVENHLLFTGYHSESVYFTDFSPDGSELEKKDPVALEGAWEATSSTIYYIDSGFKTSTIKWTLNITHCEGRLFISGNNNSTTDVIGIVLGNAMTIFFTDESGLNSDLFIISDSGLNAMWAETDSAGRGVLNLTE